jgi:CubicO group peptidase (beta-lactamase class C family)
MLETRKISRAARVLMTTMAAFSSSLVAQDGNPAARVDSLVAVEMRWQRIPGLSLAVVRDGRVVLARGYGMANLEHQVPVKPETIFQSGSVGKQFTATLVMMLVEEGKIGLDDPITRYFPDGPEAWKAITVRHLLTHTGGTTDYPEDFDFRRDYTEDELLKRAATIPLAFTPGERWSYSNLGYLMLGVLIHKVSGKFYGDLLDERIFTPLGMETARVITEEDIVPNRAAGYRLDKGEVKNQEWVAPTINTTADGSLYLTALDMAKWDAALYGERLLKRVSLEQMWAPVRLNDGKTEPYGFGWRFDEVNGQRIIEHGGAWQGFTSFIARYPGQRLTVIVFTNLSGADPGRVAHRVAGLYDPQFAPVPVAAIADREPSVTAMTRALLQAFASGTPDTTVFTSEARARIFPDRAKQATEVLRSLGTMTALELVERSEAEGNRVYRYRVRYPGQNLMVGLTLTRDNKVAGVRMQPE